MVRMYLVTANVGSIFENVSVNLVKVNVEIKVNHL